MEAGHLGRDKGNTRLQCMPLRSGGINATSGAGDIACTGYFVIQILTDCTIYVNAETTKTVALTAPAVFAIDEIDTLHVDKAVSYILA